MDQTDLPLGTSDFGALRRAGQVCVDKTALIHELASGRRKYFLSRPGRFGKSLLVSALASLFREGLRDFRGLAIESLWKDEGRYRVLAFDFSCLRVFSSFEDFCSIFDQYLTDFMLREGLELPAGMKAAGLRGFTNWLALQPVDSTVILVDDCDAPLTAARNDPELLERVAVRLSSFYETVKSLDGAVRFFFMTGVTRFIGAGIFSGFNNVTDITLHPRYGALLGFTPEEAGRYFSAHLDRAAQALGLGREELIEELERRFGGFCFDRRASVRVLAPWPLLRFLEDPGRKLTEDGFDDLCPKSCAPMDPERFAAPKSIALRALGFAADSDVGRLVEAGCLAVRRVVGTTAYLDYPNAEVRKALAKRCLEALLKGKTPGEEGLENAAVLLAEAPPEEAAHLFNRFFRSAGPVRGEASARAFVHVFLAASGLDPVSPERESTLEVRAGSRRWMLEFKEECAGEAAEPLQGRSSGEKSRAGEVLRMTVVLSSGIGAFVRREP